MRSIGILALIGAVVLLVAPAAEARGGRHPYFNDQGTLTWYHSLAEAKAAAQRENKLIFVEFGRLRCSQCRVLCNSILPNPRVRGRLRDLAVGLAADCDQPEPIIDAMFRRHLPYAKMLPFVAFLTPDGEYITGYGGSTSVDTFLAHVRRAEARRPRACAPCAPCTAPPAQQPRRSPVVPPPAAVAPRPAPCEAPPRPPVAVTPARPVRPVRPAQPLPAPRGDPVVAVRPAPAPTPAAAVPPAPVRRPVEVPPALVGSPDAVAIAPGMGEPGSDGCCAPPRRAPRTGPLPAPRIVISPPVKIARGSPGLGRAQPGTSRAQPVARTGSSPSRGRSSQALTRDEARRAADRSEWADVLLAAASAPDDEVLRDLVDRANRWAHERLASAALDIREGRYDEGLAAVEAVLVQMGGQPVAVDANRGLGAIQTLLELRHLNPDGAVAKTVRRNAQAEYRGTRWSSLF